MVRVIRFQSEESLKGTTGSIRSESWTREFSPTPKLVLFWNGTEIREAMGFCACLAISGESSATAGALCQSGTRTHNILSLYLARRCTLESDSTQTPSIASPPHVSRP